MKTTTRVSLREIAERCGVTRMAVSLALRGKPGVSAATRKQVRAIAQQLGYAPDPEVAKLLSHIRVNAPAEAKACLALLTSGATAREWMRSVTEQKYVEGAHARAREYGYRVENFWLHEPGLSPARLSNILWNRGIEGVIFAPLRGARPGRAPRSVGRASPRFSVVEISGTVESPDLDRSIHDQYTAMMKCLDELTALHYQSIGLVLEEALDARVNGKWTAAYLRHGQQSATRGRPPPLILPGLDQKAFDRWYDRHRPEAIVSVDRFGLRLLQARGLKIPKQVGYASLDLDGDRADFPGLSGIDQNSLLVGAAAVDMLVAAIQRGQRGIPAHPMRMEVEGTWTPGTSTAARRRRPAAALRK